MTRDSQCPTAITPPCLRAQITAAGAGRALEECYAVYRQTVDSIEEYAFVADHRLRLLQVNRALRRRIEDAGLPAPGEGQPLFRALPCLPPASRGEYLRVLRTGIPVVSEETLRFDGEQRTVRVSKTPVRAGGQVSQVVAVLRDLTEQRRLERMIVEISTAAMCRR